ncbi:MAG: signal peptide peptidase SppA [Xanthomonadaceae bacterium]|jgi:protease-4|nr:signal peptide peptidase SppA [Xanthomonadaceae bacterium]
MSETPRKSNIFVRIIRFLWGGVNFTRRLVFGALAVFLLIGIIASLGGSGPVLQEKTALVIAPKGAIVEQYTGSPADRALAKALGEEVFETQLRDILRAIDGAAADPNIDRIVIVPDQLASAGYATLVEIGAALKRFKASGKEIIAFGDGMEQRGYYLAAHADKIYLHPEGAVLLEGIGRYRTYFKDAFEKFGVEARLFRVGEYKSAGEPYIRADASPEAKEADLFWMGDLWQRYLAEVSALRKIEDGKLAADIDNYVGLIKSHSGDLAKLALEQRLVDELKTRDEVRALLTEKGAADEENKTFRQIAVEDYAKLLAAKDLLNAAKPAVGIVVAEGEIVGGTQPPGMIGGDSTARLIRNAREDENIKAVVLRVDSPGGGVFPSEVIRREVELTRAAGKPVIVSMGDLAASGGYWISMNAEKIYASPSTITGSIGIFGLWVNFPQALGKLGLRTDGTSTTWIAGAVDPTREYDPRLGEVIQSVIDRGYQQFIGKVADARGKQPAEIDTIARGRVWSGAQAKERGLVDELGNLDDAIKAAAASAGLTDWRLQYVEKERSPFEQAFADFLQSRIGAAVAAQGVLPTAWMPPQAMDEIARAQRVLADAARKRPAAIYAHCECDAR